MNVLLLGSGGREHAFAWKLKQSPKLDKLWIAPGNAGTVLCGENVKLSPIDFDGIKNFVISNNIDLVMVGPEDPLVKGIVDFFSEDNDIKNVKIIGPSKLGAMLEGSKDFAKAFMKRNNIPTAQYNTFSSDNFQQAIEYLHTIEPPYVLKADGLAAGKGVIICDEISQAEKELEGMLKNLRFGDASKKVVIEQFLKGIELSIFVVTDGQSFKILPEAKDYKRIGEGDTGPNTGGMGAVSPVPFADKAFIKKIEERIIKPTIKGLQDEHIDYKGFIFIGLMNVDGEPFVIEYNVRMGDPESEVAIPRIKTDLLDMLIAIADEKLDTIDIETDERTATTVILVSQGYPGYFEKGKIIEGIENIQGSLIFHAGTTAGVNGNTLTNGGRVMAVTSLDKQMKQALQRSYSNAEKIQYEGKYCRKDIGCDLFSYL
ncbi:MAG: phosphoribosylamine--glycine ligase [Bacteroidales bacterium]|jgi:phosphoribosylamine--glycine ligase